MLLEITIRPVLNGFVVKVGCQTVVFNNLNTLCNELLKYYTDPKGTEKSYRKDAINAELLNSLSPVPPEHRDPETLGQLVNRLGRQSEPMPSTCPTPDVPCKCEQSEAPR